MKPLIAKLISDKTKLGKEEIEKMIEIPPQAEMGDYAFPCFSLSKIEKKSPNQIAMELGRKITIPKEIEKIQIQGPYINFFVNRTFLAEKILRNILKEKTSYGREKQNKSLLIEHTSINPNSSPHVGRIRNSLIGDSIVRVLKFLGNKIETHYYVNDVSKQIAMLTLICNGTEKFEDLLGKYIEISDKVKKNPELETRVFETLKLFEQGDPETRDKFKNIVDIAIQGQKNILEELDIKFDSFNYESDYLKEQASILDELIKSGKLFKDGQGRAVLDQRGTSLDNQMKTAVFVLTRNDGTGLYPLRDIAYTRYKANKSKNNIIVLGEDQKLYFKQLSNALAILNIPLPKPVHYSFITLQTEEGNKKMSTRSGDVVLVEDFLKEAEEKAAREIDKRKTKGDPVKIALSAIKYSILRQSNETPINFDLSQALSFEGETGPYLLYSYARASSIVKKSKKSKLSSKEARISDAEYTLIKKLGEFPEIVKKVSLSFNPSLLAHYSYDLSQLFNEFYHSDKVIGDEKQAFRLALVECFRIVLKSSLYLLGIETIEEM